MIEDLKCKLHKKNQTLLEVPCNFYAIAVDIIERDIKYDINPGPVFHIAFNHKI